MLNYVIVTVDTQGRTLCMQAICADNNVDQLTQFAEILDKTDNFKEISIERKQGVGEPNKVVWMSKR